MAEKTTSIELPEEIWALIFSHLQSPRIYSFESISLVCKQFLSISNKLRTSLIISPLTAPVPPQIFHRFKQLNHIDLRYFKGDLDSLLFQISQSGLVLQSLTLSNQRCLPSMSLRILGSKQKSLRTLICSQIGTLRDLDLILISEFFPNLQELDISYPENKSDRRFTSSSDYFGVVTDKGILALSSNLKLLYKVNISGNTFITDKSLLALSANCLLLGEITICGCAFITQTGIARALSQNRNLNSVSAKVVGFPTLDSCLVDSLVCLKALCALDLSDSYISDELLYSLAEASLPLKKLILAGCVNFTFSGISFLLVKNQCIEYLDLVKANFLTDKAMFELSQFLPRLNFINLNFCSRLTNFTLFTLICCCPTLNEIRMERTRLGEGKNPTTNFIVNPQLKTLYLSGNEDLCNENIKKIVSVCPNLELLQMDLCKGITEEGITELLKKCSKIRHLGLNYCCGVKNFVIDFEVSALEVLEMAGSRIDDAGLEIIGKRCRGLISLNLFSCSNLTGKGVMEVARNCRRLRDINLSDCRNLDDIDVVRMVFSSPSPRKIITSIPLLLTESQTRMFMDHGRLVLEQDFRQYRTGLILK